MNIRISKNDIVWSYLGYIVRICSNVILLPIIVKKLPTEELGVWYVFLSLGALIQLLDFGFTPTIMRNISYAFGGATNIQKKGIEANQIISSNPNYELINKLIYVAKKIYFYIAVAAVFILITFGTYYINHLTKHLSNINILIAWLIYSIGVFCNFYYSYWIPILNGVGKIKQVQHATLISQLTYLVIALAGISASYGLIAIASAFFVSGLVLRKICRFYFQKDKQDFNTGFKEEECKEIFDIVWYTARQMGLVFIGSFLILQANTLICSTFLGLKSTAEYGLTLQLFTVVSTFSGIVFRTYLPMISEARIKGCQSKLKKYLALTSIIGWFSYLAGAVAIIVFGDMILNFIGSKTVLLPRAMLIFMTIYLFLEFNHSNFATFIVTNNEVPFVKAAIISGFCIVIGSWGFVYLFELGLWGLMLSQAIVQLSYNNWKWPQVVLKQIGMRLSELMFLGLKECKSKIGLERNKYEMF